MMCSTYAWRTNWVPFAHATVCRRAHVGKVYEPLAVRTADSCGKSSLPEQVTMAKIAKAMGGRRGVSGGRPTTQPLISDCASRIQTWRHRRAQKRPDLGFCSCHPLRRCDVEPDQPRITA